MMVYKEKSWVTDSPFRSSSAKSCRFEQMHGKSVTSVTGILINLCYAGINPWFRYIFFMETYCEFVLQFASTIVSLLLSTFVCVYGKSIKHWIFFPRKIHSLDVLSLQWYCWAAWINLLVSKLPYYIFLLSFNLQWMKIRFYGDIKRDISCWDWVNGITLNSSVQ